MCWVFLHEVVNGTRVDSTSSQVIQAPEAIIRASLSQGGFVYCGRAYCGKSVMISHQRLRHRQKLGLRSQENLLGRLQRPSVLRQYGASYELCITYRILQVQMGCTVGVPDLLPIEGVTRPSDHVNRSPH